MAYSFNVTSDYLIVPGDLNAGVAVDVPLTFSVWFKTPTQTRATARVLLEIGDLANACCGASNGAFRLVIPGGVSYIRANAFVGTTAYVADTAAGSLVANTWMHAAAVFASNSSRTIYLSNATPVTNTQTLNIPHGYYLSIASTWASTPTAANFFSGDMAEIGVWRAALTAAEINSLARGVSCSKIRPESVFCYFPLVRELKDEFARAQPNYNTDGRQTLTIFGGLPVPSSHPRIYS
jgi:hypothetical protein